jgi:hypothetical protein
MAEYWQETVSDFKIRNEHELICNIFSLNYMSNSSKNQK